MVYCGCTGIGLKWFPDKRGMAAGIIAAGFGSGSAPFIPILASILKKQDYHAAFLYTGIFQGLLIIAAAQFLGRPKSGSIPVPAASTAKKKTRSGGDDFNSIEMLKTAHFAIMWAAMLMMGIGGLMVTAQSAVVAREWKVVCCFNTPQITA